MGRAKLIDFMYTCDKCTQQVNTMEYSKTGREPQTIKEADKLMRHYGWKILPGGRVLCNDCAEDK